MLNNPVDLLNLISDTHEEAIKDYVMNTFVDLLKAEHAAAMKAKASAFAKAEAKKQRAFMASQKRQANAQRVENSALRNEDFYYTDSSKYAKQYYGETYYETTRHDNDWG